MDSRQSHVAFALKGRSLHLCVNDGTDSLAPTHSLCGICTLESPWVRVAHEDLANMHTLMICKACEASYEQHGYREKYASAPVPGSFPNGQLALF